MRGRLLAWIVLPLAGAVVVDGVISHRNAAAIATVVQDRLLLGSARIVAEQLRFEDGTIQERIPPAALELFQSSDIDHVFYRVITSNGRTATGYAEFQLPDSVLQLETPQFFDSSVRGQPVRAVAYLQPVLTETGIQPVRVQIAQTMQGHAQLTSDLWQQAMLQHLVTLALVALLVLVGLRACLQPLMRLRHAVLARRPGSLEALDITAMPVELTPLVGAINEYAQRLEQHTNSQQAFIQNAAHQLRTPLTLLTTQVSYALRGPDINGHSESLAAIRQSVQQAVRLVNQLLTLSAAEARGPAGRSDEVTPLDAVVRQVLEDMAGRAQARQIDLGFEGSTEPVFVAADPVTLREIVMNLVDNAIRYAHPGGIVTSRIASGGSTVTLTVEDDGPGIPVDLRQRVFERFYRIDNRESDGCGLGLAIVKELTLRLGGQIELRTPPSGHGIALDILLPAAPSAPVVALASPPRLPPGLGTR